MTLVQQNINGLLHGIIWHGMHCEWGGGASAAHFNKFVVFFYYWEEWDAHTHAHTHTQAHTRTSTSVDLRTHSNTNVVFH